MILWRCAPPMVEPKVGNKRIVNKFAILPTKVVEIKSTQAVWVWLHIYQEEQRYTEHVFVRHDYGYSETTYNWEMICRFI